MKYTLEIDTEREQRLGEDAVDDDMLRSLLKGDDKVTLNVGRGIEVAVQVAEAKADRISDQQKDEMRAAIEIIDQVQSSISDMRLVLDERHEAISKMRGRLYRALELGFFAEEQV